MTQIVSPTGGSTPVTVIQQAKDWRSAVDSLVPWLVANGRCFTSGEIAAYLRTTRPDLRLSVPAVGEYLRQKYDDGDFPSYDDNGQQLYPTQVPRLTTGIATTLDGRVVVGRTPANVTVFVYAMGTDGYAHDFEIYIPDWDDPGALRAVPHQGPSPASVVSAAAAQAIAQGQPVPTPPPPTTAVAVIITGSLKRDELVADVRLDGRLCVPRGAFEAFVHVTGQPLRGGPNGDAVHVLFVDDNGKQRVEITRDAVPGSAPFHLWKSRGRIALRPPAGFGPWQSGEQYDITVDQRCLTIDLSQTTAV